MLHRLQFAKNFGRQKAAIKGIPPFLREDEIHHARVRMVLH